MLVPMNRNKSKLTANEIEKNILNYNFWGIFKRKEQTSKTTLSQSDFQVVKIFG